VEVTVEVPVQYFQSVIALETAVTGVLLFQIQFFATNKDAPKDTPQDSDVDPRLRVLLLVVLTATVFGSLEAIREGRGRWSAILVTVGLAVSVLPILLRVLPPLQRDARTQQRHPHYWITMLGLVLYAVIVLLIIAHP
jgi:ribose/xylose/arabinose/galactoside ABC-type transport system permease subunit